MAVPYSQMRNEMVLDPTVTLSALKVYQVIFTNTLNRAGWNFSYPQLAEEASIGRTSAIAAVKWLEEKGWITTVKGHGFKNPNLYAITDPVATPTASASKGAVERTGKGAVDRPHQEIVTRREEPIAHLAASESAFEAFWAAYPRKVGKGAAIKAWRKVGADEAVAVVAAASAFKDEAAGTEPKFIPHPATWLNSQRWLDEKPTAPKSDYDGWMR